MGLKKAISIFKESKFNNAKVNNEEVNIRENILIFITDNDSGKRLQKNQNEIINSMLATDIAVYSLILENKNNREIDKTAEKISSETAGDFHHIIFFEPGLNRFYKRIFHGHRSNNEQDDNSVFEFDNYLGLSGSAVYPPNTIGWPHWLLFVAAILTILLWYLIRFLKTPRPEEDSTLDINEAKLSFLTIGSKDDPEPQVKKIKITIGSYDTNDIVIKSDKKEDFAHIQYDEKDGKYYIYRICEIDVFLNYKSIDRSEEIKNGDILTISDKMFLIQFSKYI